MGQDEKFCPQVPAGLNQGLLGAHLEITGYEQLVSAGLDPNHQRAIVAGFSSIERPSAIRPRRRPQAGDA
jgi:hypothetical protein